VGSLSSTGGRKDGWMVGWLGGEVGEMSGRWDG
jgi:hypothetical protein